jgi:hypothetical protein
MSIKESLNCRICLFSEINWDKVRPVNDAEWNIAPDTTDINFVNDPEP